MIEYGKVTLGGMTMRNGMRMALAMAFMVGCLPPGALARSSDPPEPVLGGPRDSQQFIGHR